MSDKFMDDAIALITLDEKRLTTMKQLYQEVLRLRQQDFVLRERIAFLRELLYQAQNPAMFPHVEPGVKVDLDAIPDEQPPTPEDLAALQIAYEEREKARESR